MSHYNVRVTQPNGAIFDAQIRNLPDDIPPAEAFLSALESSPVVRLFKLYPSGEAGTLKGGAPVYVPTNGGFMFESQMKDGEGNPF